MVCMNVCVIARAGVKFSCSEKNNLTVMYSEWNLSQNFTPARAITK